MQRLDNTKPPESQRCCGKPKEEARDARVTRLVMKTATENVVEVGMEDSAEGDGITTAKNAKNATTKKEVFVTSEGTKIATTIATQYSVIVNLQNETNTTHTSLSPIHDYLGL